MGEQREWRPVPFDGFGESYEVSNFGEVRSRKTGHYRLLRPKYNKRTGYTYVNLFLNGEGLTRSIHRLVALAFIPNPYGYSEVNHIDEDKTNNCVSNLEWCTSSYNNEYSKHKRQNPVDVFDVDGKKLGTFVSEKAACSVLGVSKASVSQAVKGSRCTSGGFILKYSESE